MPTEQQFTEKVIDVLSKTLKESADDVIEFVQNNIQIIHDMYADYSRYVKHGKATPEMLMNSGVDGVVNCLMMLY